MTYKGNHTGNHTGLPPLEVYTAAADGTIPTAKYQYWNEQQTAEQSPKSPKSASNHIVMTEIKGRQAKPGGPLGTKN